MTVGKPMPLFPTYSELKDFSWDYYGPLRQCFSELPSWCLEHWSWAKEYLLYLGRNKSEHTYVRFRSDVEKFLLWSFLIAKRPILAYRKQDLLDYGEFFFKPPISWIALSNVDKFVFGNGSYQLNSHWRPFCYRGSKDWNDRKKYRPSQQSLLAMFSAISSFYTHLMELGHAVGNPAIMAKKDCPRLILDAQVKENKRLDHEQWQFLLKMATDMAESDDRYERNLFLVATMKSLFLRISELSERADWIPAMNHFWQDHDKNWWLKVYGKGKKLRDISVPPSYLVYLERYRVWRGLSALPGRKEQTAIVEKIRGSGGMTSRQLARLVHQVLEYTYHRALKQFGAKEAQIYTEVSPHWLRHTGASLEIERGRELKDLSEDLGHSSMATTDTIYVQSSAKKRAASGKDRPV